MDKIQFAKLVAFIAQCCHNHELNEYDIERLAALTDAPAVPKHQCSAADLNALLYAMHAGQRIEAIKQYRSLTNEGLLESKDAVERYWLHGGQVPV